MQPWFGDLPPVTEKNGGGTGIISKSRTEAVVPYISKAKMLNVIAASNLTTLLVNALITSCAITTVAIKT